MILEGIALPVAYADTPEAKREAFVGQVEARLRVHGIAFVSAVFGRSKPGDKPIWLVTVRTRDGVDTHPIAVPEDVDPFSRDARNHVVECAVYLTK